MGQDFLQQFIFKQAFAVGQYPAGHEFAVTDAFRGSDYNGTFSLTKKSDTGTSSVWEYVWDNDPPTCGSPKINVTLSDAATGSGEIIYLDFTIAGLRYVDFATTTPKGLNDFSCSLSTITVSGGVASGVVNQRALGFQARSRICSQLPDLMPEFTNPILSWPVFPAPSDDARRGTFTITSETLPSDTTLYTPTGSSTSAVRRPIVKLTQLAVFV